MHSRVKIFVLAAIVLCAVNLSQAQGTLQATLLPDPPDSSSLFASVVVNTPDTNGIGPFFSVAFEITVNSNGPIFTVGRIAGGSTAWAFDLDAPTITNGSMLYTGTTGMQAFQIDDMLANRTDFELYYYPTEGGAYAIGGALVAVPEPRTVSLLSAGLVIACLKNMRRTYRRAISFPNHPKLNPAETLKLRPRKF